MSNLQIVLVFLVFIPFDLIIAGAVVSAVLKNKKEK